MASTRNDARLWALLADLFRQAGTQYPDDAQRYARTAVAIVRRERATGNARTWAPGEAIPYDVAKVYDLDGCVWDRQSTDPESTMRDAWRMRGFDPGEHEPSCGGVHLTPYLLDAWGPLTEVRRG
ncbi:hypothetical protein O7626_39695 [Micromonospora sp. WMMD1102]|uniref:hypothetical protein n=1 Tax=Micromonospora sp. WMMD1102 TaxID=3016105 RepID=UPI0024152D8D|nr:hypothetical protein [Micromonospora sp. WMMD1102]MDG4791939.1 hypothetical protein [Micromonospora sp. WMMD1102]